MSVSNQENSSMEISVGHSPGIQLAQLQSVLVLRGARWISQPLESNLTLPIQKVTSDSRLVDEHTVFVAVKGTKADGHRYLPEVCSKNPIAIVVEDPSQVPPGYSGVAVVGDSRATLTWLGAELFHRPSSKLFCVGVTGTNGKTSTSYLVEHLLNSAGDATGVIGTINHHLREKVWPTSMTTPDPVIFQERLFEFLQDGATSLATEVTSHALDQARIDAVDFDVAIFTNLTRDHLDYHLDMDRYFLAKSKLFTDLLLRSAKKNKTAIINIDDEYGERLAQEVQRHTAINCWTYGKSKAADFQLVFSQMDFSGIDFSVISREGQQSFHLPMTGEHNAANAVAAILAARVRGVPWAQLVEDLKTFSGVPGRLQAVRNSRGLHILVDYAHTDDALQSVLGQLSKVRTQAGLKNKIITVFGCGGDRDRGKRPMMMRAALAGSDHVVLTSDNPRTEDPNQILQDALAGLPKSGEHVPVDALVDRKRAIAHALGSAKAGDVVLIAGKGHETTQEIGTVKYPFSDFEVVREVLSSKGE